MSKSFASVFFWTAKVYLMPLAAVTSMGHATSGQWKTMSILSGITVLLYTWGAHNHELVGIKAVE